MGGGNEWSPDQQGSFLRANMPWLQRMQQVNQSGPFGSVEWSGGGDHVATPRDSGAESMDSPPGAEAGTLAESMAAPADASMQSAPPTPASSGAAQGSAGSGGKGGAGGQAMPAAKSSPGSVGRVSGGGLADELAKKPYGAM